MMGILDGLKYVYTELSTHYNDTEWWFDRLLHRINVPFQGTVYPTYSGAIDVMSSDWDTLLVLDALRIDLFEEVANLDQFTKYRQVQSKGSATPEWTKRNFSGRKFGDTVYVSANPFTSKIAGDAFHDLVEVWHTDFDDNEGTVLPTPVIDAALDTRKSYPNKRLIVHFMQPHYPFVGEKRIGTGGWQPEDILSEDTDRPNIASPWDALREGMVKKDSVWKAYADNLRFVLGPALELGAELSGKTVITSDHGNMMGERSWPIPLRVYEHPSGLRHRELTNVPWAILPYEDRLTVIDQGTTTTDPQDEQERRERLQQLGYLK